MFISSRLYNHKQRDNWAPYRPSWSGSFGTQYTLSNVLPSIHEISFIVCILSRFSYLRFIGNSASICLTSMLIITLSLVREIELFLGFYMQSICYTFHISPPPHPEKMFMCMLQWKFWISRWNTLYARLRDFAPKTTSSRCKSRAPPASPFR